MKKHLSRRGYHNPHVSVGSGTPAPAHVMLFVTMQGYYGDNHHYEANGSPATAAHPRHNALPIPTEKTNSSFHAFMRLCQARDPERIPPIRSALDPLSPSSRESYPSTRRAPRLSSGPWTRKARLEPHYRTMLGCIQAFACPRVVSDAGC